MGSKNMLRSSEALARIQGLGVAQFLPNQMDCG